MAQKILKYVKDPPHALDSFSADVIIGPDDQIVKDKSGNLPRMATKAELDAALIIDRTSLRSHSVHSHGDDFVSRQLPRARRRDFPIRAYLEHFKPVSLRPEIGWKWLKWTFGFWSDPSNCTFFGIDIGPLEIVWRLPGYRP